MRLPGPPVLGIGEIDQAVVAGLGAKRKVVDIAAQGAREFHVASNQDNGRRADALILYVRCNTGEHNTVALGVVLYSDRLPDEVFDAAV